MPELPDFLPKQLNYRRMTLPEAIKHLEEELSNPDHDWGCDSCRYEHEQLLEWLKELQTYREAEETGKLLWENLWSGTNVQKH